MDERSRKRDAVLQLLAAPILKELGGGGVGVGWILVAVLGAGGLVLCACLGLGVVVSPWSSHGASVLIPYFAATVFLVTGLVRARLGARAPTGWAPGRYLLAEGFVDARDTELRARSIADLTRIEIRTGAPGPSGMSLFTIEAWFGGALEKFILFGTERNIPRAQLDTLMEKRDALVAGRKTGQGDPLAEWTAATPPRRRRLSDFSWTVGALVGIFVAALLELAVLPSLSLRAVSGARGDVQNLRAVRDAYPFPWIKGRAEAAIHARFAAAHAKIAARFPVAKRAPFDRIVDLLEGHEGGVIRFQLVPPDPDQLKAATTWLNAQARIVPGARPAPVILGYQVVSLAGTVIGERQLSDALALRMESIFDRDIATLETGPRDFSEPNPADRAIPTIEVRSQATPVTTYQGAGGRLYAGLAFSFDARLIFEGEPAILLATPVTISPPSEVGVGRLTFAGQKLAPLGGSGDTTLDRMDDSLVYNEVAEKAASSAAGPLADQIFGPK